MPSVAELDYFTDRSLINDPYPYFEYLREQGPVVTDSRRGVVMVTGLDEAVAVEGDDISDVIEQHRSHFPMCITFDGAKHAAYRGLMRRLFTPRRLKENEDYMWRLAGWQFGAVLGTGRCEFIGEYAQPFTLLVIADLLGVPEEDRESFRGHLRSLNGPAEPA